MSHGNRRLRDLAAALGRDVEGDGDVVLSGAASLEAAGPDDLAFVRSERYAARLAASRAGAVILPEGLDAGGRPAIRSPQPELDFARALRLLVPETKPPPGVHPSAEIAPDAKLDAEVSVGPGCSIGAGCVVGRGSVLHANVTVDGGVEIGADCVIYPGCVLGRSTHLGDRVILHPGVVIGGDGFGYAPDGAGGLVKLPQVGGVRVGDDVEIGANSTVDRGSLGDTQIGQRVKIDNLVQVAHNCVIGDDAIIVSQAGLAGSTVVERGAIIMGQAGIAGHLTIGERAFVGPQTGVHRDVPAGGRVYGYPQQSERIWHRISAALVHLPRLLTRVRAIEKKLGLRTDDRKD